MRTTNRTFTPHTAVVTTATTGGPSAWTDSPGGAASTAYPHTRR